MSIIELNNVSKSYFTEEIETVALNNVSFSIESGEFVSIMGPSGCGKSTLLNIVGLIDSISSGSYLFDGKDASSLSERERTIVRRGNIGFVFQSYNLIDNLSVFQNIELPLKIMHVPSRERQERVYDIMNKMGISHRAKHYPRQLSGGQLQRVAIARACVTTPKVILADEPMGNLDSENGLEVLNLLTELNKSGATIVMVTHNIRDAQVAKRKIDLFDGGIISDNA